jgi:hypothetical protein
VPYSDEYADVTNAKGRNVGLAFVECEFEKRRGFIDKGTFGFDPGPSAQFPTRNQNDPTQFNSAAVPDGRHLRLNDEYIPF